MGFRFGGYRRLFAYLAVFGREGVVLVLVSGKVGAHTRDTETDRRLGLGQRLGLGIGLVIRSERCTCRPSLLYGRL